jgi:peptide/nickel transport system permease protein
VDAVSTEGLQPRIEARRRWPRRVEWSVALPGGFIALLLIASLIGPAVLPDPNAVDLFHAKAGLFSPAHLLGTDNLGRDILSRVVAGTQISLYIGLSVVVICLVVGGGLGVVSGYVGGAFDSVVMRVMDMILAFPSIVLALAIAAYLGPNTRNLILAIAFSQLPEYARLARAGAIAVRRRDFLVASELIGARSGHVIVRHVVPNVLPSLVVYACLAVGIAIVVAASLSFLGLGVQPPQASWGGMIADGRPYLATAPHIVLVPGVVLLLTITSLNLLADRARGRYLDDATTGVQ